MIAALTALKDILTWQGQVIPVLNDEVFLAGDVRAHVQKVLALLEAAGAEMPIRAAVPIRAHLAGCGHALSIPVDHCPCGGRDFLPAPSASCKPEPWSSRFCRLHHTNGCEEPSHYASAPSASPEKQATDMGPIQRFGIEREIALMPDEQFAADLRWWAEQLTGTPWRDGLRRLLSEAADRISSTAQPPSTGTWQPIASAPKDGNTCIGELYT